MTLYDALQHGRHGNTGQRRWWGLKGALRVGRRSEQEQRQKHVRINYRLVCSSCQYGCIRKFSETLGFIYIRAKGKATRIKEKNRFRFRSNINEPLDHFVNATNESANPLATSFSNGTIP